MLQEYVLQGLDCPNCAAKIEGTIGGLPCVSRSTVNFMTTTLRIDHDADCRCDIAAKISKIVRDMEPEVSVIAKDDATETAATNTDTDNAAKRDILRLAAGAALYGAAIAIPRFLTLPPYATDLQSKSALALFLVAYAVLGGDVILKAVKNITKGRIFDENFLMGVATIGAFAIGETSEAVAVMLFYQVGEFFQSTAIRRSKKSITALMDIRPDFANLKQDGKIQKVSPETVHPGDCIVVKPGEKIPLDGVITEGRSTLDTSALTGESLPRDVTVGGQALSGAINKSGVLVIEVTKEFGESTVAKILNLVQNAGSKKAPVENFITKFARYYTPVVVFAALALAVIPPLAIPGARFSEWINRALVFLVVSCPCALVISIPLSFFGGIGGASRNGILVKGGNYLEALNSIDTIVFDKTGTLTKGTFTVTETAGANGFTAEQTARYAAYAESNSNHPIALSIVKACGANIDREAITSCEEIAGKGIRIRMEEKTVIAGNGALLEMEHIPFTKTTASGTIVYIAVDGVFAGHLVIADELKPDSKQAVQGLKAAGVRKIGMLTGDNKQVAEKIAAELSLDTVYAELLPHQKVEYLELLDSLKPAGKKLVFVGDGINDAPVLARADIGIAMGGMGSDAAIEAADVVLMTDEPSKLITALQVAKKTRAIVWQNIIFALAVKGVFLALGALGIATMWEAVFADVGVAVIAILNAMRAIRLRRIA